MMQTANVPIRIFFLLTIFWSAVHAQETQAQPTTNISCPTCTATGTIPCSAQGCKNGTVLCPGACLKLEVGNWVKRSDSNHPTPMMWREFPLKVKGHSGGTSWSEQHCGEVIEYVDGTPTNKGKCPICGGATRIPCKKCAGKGIMECPTCHGAKTISAEALALLQKKQEEESRKNSILLKDGRLIEGKITAKTKDTVIIKRADGKIEAVPQDELADSATKAADTPNP